jgi:hypothetical protein
MLLTIFTNRPVRTRMPGGVAGEAGVTRPPYADPGMPLAVDDESLRFGIWLSAKSIGASQ